jgi:hypothetical protein
MKIEGVLEAFWETGTESVMWAIIEDGKRGYDALKIIEGGDKFMIYAEDGPVQWSGIIEPDFEIGWQGYPRNPGYGQPIAHGMWIHWTQGGFQPDDRALLFFKEFRATLEPKRRSA